MGGRALKSPEVFTRRYQRAEFEDISKELIEILSKTFSRVGMPLYYHTKESFGDADILVVANPKIKMREYITDTFQPKEIFHNGSCWSFDYKELQIDVITSSEEHYDSMYNYLCYNDLGNFIGRIAHGFGLKYGQEGLWLEHQFRGQNIGSIPLSKDMKTILEFLDLSFEKYLKGFDTLQEIFEFISKSKYFNADSFQLQELNKINRDRNKKRSSYMLFLAWVQENRPESGWNYQFEKDKSTYIDWIEATFPDADLEIEIRRLEYQTCKDLYMKAKFNGKMVMEHGFTGKDIGIHMNGFRDYLNDLDGYEETILNESKDFIMHRFEDYLAQYAEDMEE